MSQHKSAIKFAVGLGLASVVSVAVTNLIRHKKTKSSENKPVEVKPIVSETARRVVEHAWGLPTTVFTGIKHSENHTYLVECDRGRFILRLTPEDHRSKEAIGAELQYVIMVAGAVPQEVVRLCRPIQRIDGEDYITVVSPYQNDSKSWYAVLFQYATGINPITDWIGMKDEGIIEAWGLALGAIHTATIAKCGNPGKWDVMLKQIPELEETHSGAIDIKRIEQRGKDGHTASQMLFDMYQNQVAPFLQSLGDPNTSSLYGAIHSDLNVSNFFAEQRQDAKTRLWVFDFDQVHKNWLGSDVAVVLQGVNFFQDMGWIKSGFDPEKFRTTFLSAYSHACPAMVEAGHTDPVILRKFTTYREFCHTAIAVDILFQATNGRHFETAITGFCELLVQRFQAKQTKDSEAQ